MAYLFVLLCVFMLLFIHSTQADDNLAAGAGSCAAILQAGVYNTYSTSSVNSNNYSTSAFNQQQSSICESYSGYSYATYSSQSTVTNSGTQATNLDIAASFFGITASGSGGSSSSHLTETQFNQAMTQINAYQLTECASTNNVAQSTSSDAFTDALNTIAKTIDPNVYKAYISCLNLFASGVTVTQQSGIGQSNLALDFTFYTKEPGSTAYMTGINVQPNGSATCVINGQGLSSTATPILPFQLVENYVYSLVCSVSRYATLDGGVTDIYVATNPGGTYHALLYRYLPQSAISKYNTTITTLQSTVTSDNNRIRLLNAEINKLNSQIKSLTYPSSYNNSMTTYGGNYEANEYWTNINDWKVYTACVAQDGSPQTRNTPIGYYHPYEIINNIFTLINSSYNGWNLLDRLTLDLGPQKGFNYFENLRCQSPAHIVAELNAIGGYFDQWQTLNSIINYVLETQEINCGLSTQAPSQQWIPFPDYTGYFLPSKLFVVATQALGRFQVFEASFYNTCGPP